MEIDIEALRQRLREEAGEVCAVVWDRVAVSLIPERPRHPFKEKIIADTQWKVIQLNEVEVALLETPLLQRLRRVRQLGLSHLVYPSAGHSRLEHSLGTMHVARQMYRDISDVITDRGQRDFYGQLVSAAALLHDCGHVAFSHAGERVLSSLFAEEFQRVAEVLDQVLPEPFAGDGEEPHQRRSLSSGPAELLSALLVMSKRLEDYLRAGAGLGGASGNSPLSQVSSSLLQVAALILGRPCNFHHESKGGTGGHDHPIHCYDFIRSIVSGFLDADKIDYVARDSSYTIPTNADVPRLLARINSIIPTGDDMDQAGVAPDRARGKIYYLFGLSSAAISSFELFAASRAHLYDRVYRHHKVRSAEAMLFRMLDIYFRGFDLGKAKKLDQVLEMMLSTAGDDAVLNKIAGDDLFGGDSTRISAQSTQYKSIGGKTASKIARDLLDRSLLHRTLALHDDCCETETVSWTEFVKSMSLPLEVEKFNRLILNIVESQEEDTIIVDWRPTEVPQDAPNDVDENAGIWIGGSGVRSTPASALSNLNIRQHVTAFIGNRQIEWIFSVYDNRPKIAAASAIALHQFAGIVIKKDAVERAKNDVSAYQDALREYAGTPGENATSAHHILASMDERSLVVRPDFFQRLFPDALQSEADIVAGRLVKALNLVEIKASTKSLLGFSRILKHIIIFAHSRDSTINCFTPNSPAGHPEQILSNIFEDSIDHNDELRKNFTWTKGERIGGGYVDFMFKSKRPGYPNVVVELKARPESIKTIEQNHSGQIFQYMKDGVAPIGIMLSCYKQTKAIKFSETLNIWRNPAGGSRLAVITVGVRNADAAPSSLGYITEPAS